MSMTDSMKQNGVNASNDDLTPKTAKVCETQTAEVEINASEFCWELSDVKEAFSPVFDIDGSIGSQPFTDQLGNKWQFSFISGKHQKRFYLYAKLLSISEETKHRQEQLAGEKIRAKISFFFYCESKKIQMNPNANWKTYDFEDGQHVTAFDLYGLADRGSDADGVLRLYFRVVIPNLKISATRKRKASRSSDHHRALTMKLFDESVLTDCVIESSDHRRYPCHRSILSATSPVIRKCFETDMKEAREGRYEMEDADGESVQLLLKFIYKGELPASDDGYELVMKLLYMAEKYQMDVLKDACEESLCEMISLERIVQMLIDADTFKTQILKAQIIRFISSNRKKVFELSDWKALKEDNISLFCEVLQPLSDH